MEKTPEGSDCADITWQERASSKHCNICHLNDVFRIAGTGLHQVDPWIFTLGGGPGREAIAAIIAGFKRRGILRKTGVHRYQCDIAALEKPTRETG